MLIIITGKRGTGKSVVCRKVVELAMKKIGKCGGVLTYKVSGNSLVVEDIITMKQMVLAGACNTYNGPLIDNFSYNPKGIAFGLAAIEKAKYLPLIVIDEIGPLELKGEGYAGVVKLLAEPSDQIQIAAVDEKLLPLFLTQVKQSGRIFETTISNRNYLPEEIMHFIAGSRPGL